MKKKESGAVRETFRRLLALRTTLVGVKCCHGAEEFAAAKVSSAKLSFCRAVKGTARVGWSLACPPDQMECFAAQMIFGFRLPSDGDIDHHRKQFAADREIARRMVEAKPKFGAGEIAGILTRPLGDFEPDIVVFIVDALHARGLIESYTCSTGETLHFSNRVSSPICSYAAALAHPAGKPNLTIPCIGAKRYGTFQDNEPAFCIPFAAAVEMASNAEMVARQVQFPIPIGTAFLSPTIAMSYVLKTREL